MVTETILSARLKLIAPPKGVQFCLQKGMMELVEVKMSTGEDLEFVFDVRCRLTDDGGVRFLGPYTQGPPAERFVYVCSGEYAGQLGTQWSRRAKVPLGGIDRAMVEHGQPIWVAFAGTAKDGGPVCATVKLPPGAWRSHRMNARIDAAR